MSEIFEVARASVVVADFANVDAAGKVNVVGAGIIWFTPTPNGQSTPFSLLASVSVPVGFQGQEFALSLELFDLTADRPVLFPGPAGQLEAVRAQQAVTVPPLIPPPGFLAPNDAMMGHQMSLSFPNGVPLPLGHTFEARLHVDGQTRADWSARFHMLAFVPGPIMGGPANPSAIPGVGTYAVDPPEPSGGDVNPNT